MSQHVIFYDGICGFCNKSVQFVLKHDKEDRFRFAPLQSDLAGERLSKYGKDPTDLDTMYLLLDYDTANERILSKGRAAVRILRELQGWPRLFVWLAVFPDFILNFGYKLIASNRYRLFGKMDACPIPTAQQRKKFLAF